MHSDSISGQWVTRVLYIASSARLLADSFQSLVEYRK